jgi:hypothetical protein
MKTICWLLLATPLTLPAAEPPFHNRGTLDGFTGANQRAKVKESRAQDRDGNGRSLECLMLRKEPDTPNRGCHAEAHLARFPDGSPLGRHPGFGATTVYQVRFDRNCERASVGFFQYKNHVGPDQWKHLVAMWRMPDKHGEEIHFQVNPGGKSEYRYAALSATQGTALVSDRWHEVRVNGNFTNDASGWVEISINGKLVEWFHDRARKKPAGTRIRGNFLPDLPGSEWQLQLGGYGFFKDRRTEQATAWIDDIRVWNKAHETINARKIRES